MGILDHIGFAVSDYERSKAFYAQVFAPIGITQLLEVTSAETGAGSHCGFGREHPEFWIGTGEPLQGTLHAAFTVMNRGLVVAFHEAGLAAGGRDNGAPGLRPHYHPDYFAAFLLDPDGHNIEAVCHLPET